MNKIFELMLILLLIGMVSFAFNIQQVGSSSPPDTLWEKTYGGSDYDIVRGSRSVVETSDGGFVIAGYTRSFGAGNWDGWLLKVDSYGNHQWNKTYGGTDTDELSCVVGTSDGGYALTAHTRSFGVGALDFWLIKVDSFGNHEWNRTYGGMDSDYCRCVVQTPDGGYALVGTTMSFGQGFNDFWLVKVDSYGNHQWNKTYGGTDADSAYSVIQTSDGGYAICGEGFANLVKTDSSGNLQWNKAYGGRAFSVAETSDGGYVLAGVTGGYPANDAWLVKVDSSGNEQWKRTYGGPITEFSYSVVETVDGGYALLGSTNSFGAGDHDGWLIKVDPFGNQQWNRTYGGAGFEQLICIVRPVEGEYLLVGFTRSYGAGNDDFWLVRVGESISPIQGAICINPETLNLKSNGEWVTAYITLPEGYSVMDIDVATVELIHNDLVVKAADWGEVQDGVLMVKFDRAILRDHLSVVDIDDGDKFYDITLTISGTVGGTPFEGSDTITMIKK